MTITTPTPAITRSPAWRTAGRLINSTATGKGLSREDVLIQADLDWTVEQVEVHANVIEPDGVRTHDFPRRRALIRRNRDGSTLPLGIMGDGFSPVQNYDMLDTLEAIVDESGARYDSAGHVRGGAMVFAALTLPRTVSIGGRDDVQWYLLGRNGHDGSSALTIAATPIRIYCTNMLRRTFGAASLAGHTVSVKHTRNAHLRIDEARRALDVTFRYGEQWESWATSLLSQPMIDAEFASLVDRLMPVDRDAKPAIVDRHLARQAQALALWRSPTVANIAGTRWAAWNAISEWDEWVRPVRGGDSPEVTRAARQIERGTGALTERAATLLSL